MQVLPNLLKKVKMSSSTFTKAIHDDECTYTITFKLADNLGISADGFVVAD